MILVKNLESLSDQDWTWSEKYPGVKYKFLIDADFTGSSGLSIGFCEIDQGGDLKLHYHSPAELYIVTNGVGVLDKSGENEEIKTGDVVYIPSNAKHSLKNHEKDTLAFYWIFPTDRFSEVEYIPA